MHDPVRHEREQRADQQHPQEQPPHGVAMVDEIVPAGMKRPVGQHQEEVDRDQMDRRAARRVPAAANIGLPAANAGAERIPERDVVVEKRDDQHHRDERNPGPSERAVGKRALWGRQLYRAECDRTHGQERMGLDQRRGAEQRLESHRRT